MRPLDMFRLLALAAIWGASFLFLRIIAPVLGTFPTAFFRVVLATAGLLAILLLLRTRWDFRGKLGLCLVLGVINSGLPFALYSVAAQLVPAGYSAIFNATTPMMGVLIGALFFAEELTLAKIIGVFSGLGGVALLMRIGPVPFDMELLLGALACLGATACYGFGGFLTRRWINQGEGLNSEVVAFGSQLGAALCLLPLFGLSLLNAPLGRLDGLAESAGSGTGLYGVRLHPLLPPAGGYRTGQDADGDLSDPAVRCAVGRDLS